MTEGMERMRFNTGCALVLALFPWRAWGQVVADHVLVDGFEPLVDCSAELTCAIPPPGKACLAGLLREAGSGAVLRAFFNADRTCSDGAIGGACNLRLTAYDALEFASDPTGARELAVTGLVVDGCGRYRFSTVDRPPFGLVAIVADDATAGPENDLHAAGATLHSLASGQRLERFDIVAVRRDTVAKWTVSAASPFGASGFADVGTILLEFSAAGVRAAGTTVLRNGNTIATDDFYFSDPDPAQRLQVATQLVGTGVNGSALVAPAGSPTSYSGFGGEPGGCTWPSVIAASPAGVVTLVRIECPP